MSARHDAWDLLPHIASPTLVLHGSDDEMTPAVNSHLIADRVPGASAAHPRRGRHGFFDEFAEDLDPVLSRFWSEYSAG